ncbi:MAG: hypothetical protein GC181_12180 [Bacteroidetes bacterium]|nr:hypothetical protein [Bacteroidota bacterium]
MKKVLTTFLVSIILFALITWFTMKIETPVDGEDTFGFPFIFHVNHSPMCSPCPDEMSETFYGKLILDILFCLAASFGLIRIWEIFQKNRG